jgi:hypothetical protein
MSTDDELEFVDSPQPQVVVWFKVYCGLLCLTYLAVAGFSLIFLLVPPDELEMDGLEAKILGGLMLVMGLGLFVVCLIPLAVPPKPWVWVYDLVIICLGMTSACCLPISIPLLIYWLKPETKRYFGR